MEPCSTYGSSLCHEGEFAILSSHFQGRVRGAKSRLPRAVAKPELKESLDNALIIWSDFWMVLCRARSGS